MQPVSSPQFPDTRFTLLRRLPNAEDLAAWETFVRIYVPVVCGYFVGRGCSADEAGDLTKSVMIRVAERIAEFDPASERGKFRDWLFDLVTVESFTRLGETPPAESEKKWPAPCSDGRTEAAIPDSDDLWETEYRRLAFRQAADEIEQELGNGQTGEIFRRTILEQEAPDRVAEDLEMSLGAVHLSRSRLLNRMRQRISEIEVDWESGAAYLSNRLGDDES